ncbi:FAD:protein FMN transferase [Gemmatimonas sp.]|uniref:FAD:protein FMN transferase n=1 Tax=Gemmatimonas sp. TaxID=1962908 RepID=UPI0025BA7F3D|nr:FAD:protein FMN transferase [Gemmatimonas sp.]MCA2991473.1 FAD:protein FMN transferase [Gemmatimonas sp.]
MTAATEFVTTEFVTTAMSTTVSVQLVGAIPEAAARAAQAVEWFRVVEAHGSRFLGDSEVSRLCRNERGPQAVSPLLFELLRVAWAVAAATDGAFDPTLGRALHHHGFDRSWQDGHRVPRNPTPDTATAPLSGAWRQAVLDEATGTIALPPQTMLDLGGIAKGFALDLAARSLHDVPNMCVVAGGDLHCRGHNPRGAPWRTAVRHPVQQDGAACVVEVAAEEYALCTSGDYARVTAAGHHLLDPRSKAPTPSVGLRSVTVVAPHAVVADALATAAFVLGANAGAALLAEHGVDAYFIDADGTHHEVHEWGCTTFTRAGGTT